MRFNFLLVVAILAGFFVSALASNDPAEVKQVPKFTFALIGDLPYSPTLNDTKFTKLMEDINRQKISFVVHDGDFKSGSTPCTDELFQHRYDLFNSFAQPFIFIFGDNEWTDCHRASNGGYDPLERLTKLRELFTKGNESLGQQTLVLERQSRQGGYEQYRENVRWGYGDILFVGLHIVGSNNNFGRTPDMDAEYAARNYANLVWLENSFAIATLKNYRAVMLVIQANPGFEFPAGHAERAGFDDFIAALQRETIAFNKPVVLVHGDSHYFRIDKPLTDAANKRLENFTRVETFGAKDVHWLQGSVDFRDPNVFKFEQRIVEANLDPH